MSGTLTINAGTDSNGNNSIIGDLKDENGNITDTVVFSANSAENNYQFANIQGTKNTTNSVTAYRSGKTVQIKGIQLQQFPFGNAIPNPSNTGHYLYNDSTYGFVDTGLVVPSAYRSGQVEFFYWNSPMLVEASNTIYFLSLTIQENGKIGARMERTTTWPEAAAVNRWNNVNFNLTYLVP